MNESEEEYLSRTMTALDQSKGLPLEQRVTRLTDIIEAMLRWQAGQNEAALAEFGYGKAVANATDTDVLKPYDR